MCLWGSYTCIYKFLLFRLFLIAINVSGMNLCEKLSPRHHRNIFCILTLFEIVLAQRWLATVRKPDNGTTGLQTKRFSFRSQRQIVHTNLKYALFRVVVRGKAADGAMLNLKILRRKIIRKILNRKSYAGRQHQSCKYFLML